MAGERKKQRTWVGVFGVTACSLVGIPFIDAATAKCPRLRYGMREQAAIASMKSY